jgi:DNA-binding ferritin-like protein
LRDSDLHADTVDLLTGMVTEFEKNGWFLRASLEGI